MNNNQQLTDIESQQKEIEEIKRLQKEEAKRKAREAKGPSKSEIKKMRREQKQAIISSMSEAEYKDFELEKLRYFNNKSGYLLAYVGIVFSLITCFIGLNTMAPKYFLGGFGGILAILMNIVILLSGFLSAEKVKTYSIGYSKYVFGLGIVSFLRIFWYPLSTIILYHQLRTEVANGTDYATIQTMFTGKLGFSLIGGTAVDKNGLTVGSEGAGAFDHFITTGYLTSNGYIRGIIMIVCLAISAAAFIASGIISYTKSVKLRNYVENLKKN